MNIRIKFFLLFEQKTFEEREATAKRDFSDADVE
jgi:hypothetical protein